ncbi:ABC transporter ATP-binding protein [Trueperella sp.]|uniref:ABC transporter ATP-binding protein n=1 Tax=Trueperella sp. TaxID=2699835 RepID=UPI0022EB7FA6|nr:ABC transporter ATP-binding protein [Trueperella sp.]
MLAVHDLHFSYPKSEETLFGGLNYSFSEGSLTVVTGPSGCGKSTLLYILGLMLKPTRGAVMLGGKDVSHASNDERARARAKSYGFVFQDSALDPTRPIIDSVIEPALYAGWSRRRARARARDLLELTGVAHRWNHQPGEISGGQAQRVALARALVNDPPVMLADEPTGNLDRANAAAVLGLMHEQARAGRTVVVVTHDPYVVSRADELVELS